METCEYTKVFTDAGIAIHGYDKNTWKPLLRQAIICFGVICNYFLLGVFLGAPTVIVAQIRRDANSTEIVTDEMLSWLTSTVPTSSLPFVIIMPLLFHYIGRKLSFLIVCSLLLIGFFVLYISSNVYHILISEIFVGVSSSSLVTVAPVIIAEYTSPKYRGIFLTLKSASIFWGIWVSNAIGTFFHWKNIPVVSFVCSVYIISLIIWPESPYWLAMKGRYAECASSHRWLKGISKSSEKELGQLITSQRNINNSILPSSSNTNNCVSFLSSIWSTIKLRAFYKPVLICLTLFAQYQFTGKVIITMYAIDVLKHLTENEAFVYKEMLILDGVTVFSMYVGCILSRYYKRRTLLISFSSIGISLLYILSLYSYLVSWSILKENPVILLLLLSGYSISVSCGPLILLTSIYGELIPIRYQKLAMIFIGIGATIIVALLLKLSPFMFRSLKMPGCFLFYATSSTILFCIICIYLPETKDKTIQEIEEYFNESELQIELRDNLLQKN